jgi:hypothetical protein
MALTPAEKQKRYRERKEKEAQVRAHETNSFLKQPFDEWLGNLWSDEITFDLDLVGVQSVGDFPGNGDIDPFWKEEWGEGPNRGAIGAAERMVGVLGEAAYNLARRINQYKSEEIAARIAEIEAADLTDPAVKKQALADIAKLTKYRDELSKSVRWTLPQWKVKGE